MLPVDDLTPDASIDADREILSERQTVPFEPTDRVTLGRTGVSVTRLGLGGASIGGLYSPVADAEATATLERAWDLGVRYYDTAPLYGYGSSERRFGAGPRRPAAGRLRPVDEGRPPDPARSTPSSPARTSTARPSTGRRTRSTDGPSRCGRSSTTSADGVRRSIEESLARLGLERIDIAFIHDPDDHWEAAIEGAYPALHRLREEGVIGAIGAGMNQSAMLARFAREGDFDVVPRRRAGTRCSTRTALAELLPLCVERGDRRRRRRGDEQRHPGGSAPRAVDVRLPPGRRSGWSSARARIGAVCERHGVPLKAAAIQFPLAHPAVASVVAGVRRVSHLDDYPIAMRAPIDPDLWAELRSEGLIPPAAPTPGRAGPRQRRTDEHDHRHGRRGHPLPDLAVARRLRRDEPGPGLLGGLRHAADRRRRRPRGPRPDVHDRPRHGGRRRGRARPRAARPGPLDRGAVRRHGRRSGGASSATASCAGSGPRRASSTWPRPRW